MQNVFITITILKKVSKMQEKVKPLMLAGKHQGLSGKKQHNAMKFCIMPCMHIHVCWTPKPVYSIVCLWTKITWSSITLSHQLALLFTTLSRFVLSCPSGGCPDKLIVKSFCAYYHGNDEILLTTTNLLTRTDSGQMKNKALIAWLIYCFETILIGVLQILLLIYLLFKSWCDVHC